MKIAVIGSGGVGAFHAGALMTVGTEVRIVSVPRHVDAVSARGLRVVTDGGEVVHHPTSVSTDGAGVGACEEVQAVAAAHGIALTDEDIARAVARLDDVAPDATTSLQRDLQAGRPNELEFLNGALVERARAHGIDVPVNETALAVARLHAERRHV